MMMMTMMIKVIKLTMILDKKTINDFYSAFQSVVDLQKKFHPLVTNTQRRLSFICCCRFQNITEDGQMGRNV